MVMQKMYQIHTGEVDFFAHTGILRCQQIYNGPQNFEIESINEKGMSALQCALHIHAKDKNLYITLQEDIDPEGNSVNAIIHTLRNEVMIPCAVLPIGE